MIAWIVGDAAVLFGATRKNLIGDVLERCGFGQAVAGLITDIVNRQLALKRARYSAFSGRSMC